MMGERAGGASERAMGHGEARANLDVGGGHAALLELVDEDEGLRELLEGFFFLCELGFRALQLRLSDGALILDSCGGHDPREDEVGGEGGSAERLGKVEEPRASTVARAKTKCDSHSCEPK